MREGGPIPKEGVRNCESRERTSAADRRNGGPLGRLVIVVRDGDIEEVLSDGAPPEVAVVDYDTDEDDPDELLPVPDVEDGEVTDALVVMVNVEVNPGRVAEIHTIVKHGVAAPG